MNAVEGDRPQAAAGRDAAGHGAAGHGGHSLRRRLGFGALALLFFFVFVALGTWQLKRRVWKLDLIARVEQRVHAPAVGAPGPDEWPRVIAATHEYRHVTAGGTFVDASQTLVQAVTDLGSGYWVLTPLKMADGTVVLVNRGFVQADDRGRVAPAMDTTGGTPSGGGARVIGLLRMPEPGGAFLRHNDPATDHWYSRDVQAIATARGLTHVAPYFIDADGTLPVVEGMSDSRTAPSAAVRDNSATLTSAAMPENSATLTSAVTPGNGVHPVGGLTVIAFHNSHLVYAITWYTLALLVGSAIWLGIRNETRA